MQAHGTWRGQIGGYRDGDEEEAVMERSGLEPSIRRVDLLFISKVLPDTAYTLNLSVIAAVTELACRT